MPFLASVTEPASSSEIPTTDPERLAEVERRQKQVADFLDAQRFDALLIQHPSNFSWFTVGGENSRFGASEPTASLFITRDSRVVVTTNVDSQELFDRQLSGLGFQLKERSWSESRKGLIDDLCRGRMVATDLPAGRAQDVSAQIAPMRLPLSEVETRRLRALGRDVAHAVEAAARHLSVGMTESEAAGQLAHRLIKHGISPERLQAASDGRTKLYRHWTYSDRPIQQFCTLSAIGRRDGLSVGATRTASFGDPPAELWASFSRMSLILATGLYFSQPRWELSETWSRVHRIYEKFGAANEWQLSEQGEVVGYSTNEISVHPRSTFCLEPGMPVHWHPSVGAAVGGDTILVGQNDVSFLTAATEPWPILNVEVKGVSVPCPDILRLPATRAIIRNSAAFYTNEGDSVLDFHLNETTIGLSQETNASVLD